MRATFLAEKVCWSGVMFLVWVKRIIISLSSCISLSFWYRTSTWVPQIYFGLSLHLHFGVLDEVSSFIYESIDSWRVVVDDVASLLDAFTFLLPIGYGSTSDRGNWDSSRSSPLPPFRFIVEVMTTLHNFEPGPTMHQIEGLLEHLSIDRSIEYPSTR